VALEMKTACEQCGATLSDAGEAWICSHECTWCADCAAGLQRICPNCQGELVLRPRRAPAAAG